MLLSVNPGPGISTEAAAALGAIAEEEVDELQRVLRDVHLINDDRAGMHDLVRQYVTELAETNLSADDRAAAFGRLLSHYQEHATGLARKAGWFLLRHSTPSPEPGSPDESPTWAARLGALDYFETEQVNLLSCLRHATEHVAKVPHSTLGTPLVELTEAMAGYLRNNGPWETAEQLQDTASHIAGKLNATRSQAIALNHLGITRRLRGDGRGAKRALRQAYEIFRELSDTRIGVLGQANTLHEMGIVDNDAARNTGELKHHKEAAKLLTEAWDKYHLVGDIIGMANSAKNHGVALAGLGEFDMAAERLADSLARYRDINDVLGEIEVHNKRGLLYQDEDPKLALNEFNEAMELMTEYNIYCLLEKARAHEGIGHCQERNGEFADALTSLEEAEDIYSNIGADRDRDRVAIELDRLRNHAEGTHTEE